MLTIQISNVPGLDGEYELSTNFTNRDFRTIKQMAGLRPMELEEAFQKRDIDLIVALAAIALRRAGKLFDENQLWDAELGSIRLIGDEEEKDASPPQTGNDENDNTSGEISDGTGEHSPPMSSQNGSGVLPSVTGAASDPTTLPISLPNS